MRISLRQVRIGDIPTIQNWYETIDGSHYTSRCSPREFDGKEGCKRETYVWYVIQTEEEDCGIIWLEKTAEAVDTAVLGIMLGQKTYFGKGIGPEAVRLAIPQALKELSFNKVRLHVRKTNSRAIRCYQKCGFFVCGAGRKQSADGQTVEFWEMVLELPLRGEKE